MARRNISPERKGIYYLGTILIVVGVLLFASVFLSGVLGFGDCNDFHRSARSEGLRAFSGVAITVLGGILRRIGTRGLAGSGIIIDPEKAREDIEEGP